MEFLKQDRYDKFWVGLILGILGALLGFALFGIAWSYFNDVSFRYFYKDVFQNSFFTDKIITVSILVDVLLFFLFMRMNWYNISKGLLAVVICAVPVVIYYY